MPNDLIRQIAGWEGTATDYAQYDWACQTTLQAKGNSNTTWVYALNLRDYIFPFMQEDKKHIIFCMENVEAEYQEREVIKKNLQSAERMARLDELTGIKNKNAFFEQSKALDERIKSGANDVQFGVLMCDLNNLKTINDVMGHAVGDEVIQKTSRMICDVFKHSPVFRIGGDEFVVIVDGGDYPNRVLRFEELIKAFEISYEKETEKPWEKLSASCGMAENASDDNSPELVFKRADKAMYANKLEFKKKYGSYR